MKRLTLILGSIFLVANFLFGLILTAYAQFNMWLNCGVVLTNTILLYALQFIKLRDAYYISLSLLVIFFGLVEFVLGLFAPNDFENNWYLIVLIILIVIEAIQLILAHYVSNLRSK